MCERERAKERLGGGEKERKKERDRKPGRERESERVMFKHIETGREQQGQVRQVHSYQPLCIYMLRKIDRG